MQGDAELKMKKYLHKFPPEADRHILTRKGKNPWSRRAVRGRQSGEEQRPQRHQNSIGLEQ